MRKIIKRKWYLFKLWLLKNRYQELDVNVSYSDMDYNEYVRQIESIDSEMLIFKNKLEELNNK